MFDELTMGHLFFKVATMSFFSNVAANCKFLIRIIRKDGLMIAISNRTEPRANRPQRTETSSDGHEPEPQVNQNRHEPDGQLVDGLIY